MAYIKGYITDKLSRLSIEVTDSELDAAYIDAGLEEGDYTAEDAPKVKSVLLAILTDLLVTPDVTEGGMSLKWDRTQVAAYCARLRAELGIVTVDPTAPVLRDASNRW